MFNDPLFCLNTFIKIHPDAELATVLEYPNGPNGERIQRQVWGLFDRNPVVRVPGTQRATMPPIHFTVVNSETLVSGSIVGIATASYDAKQTTIRVPLHIGGATADRRISGVVSQDPGMVIYSL